MDSLWIERNVEDEPRPASRTSGDDVRELAGGSVVDV